MFCRIQNKITKAIRFKGFVNACVHSCGKAYLVLIGKAPGCDGNDRYIIVHDFSYVLCSCKAIHLRHVQIH